MRTIAEHQSAVRLVLHGLADRVPEIWTGTLPAPSSEPRVLAQDVLSPIDLPPFDNSQMDGYAVRADEVVPGVPLAVGERIPAGSGIHVLSPGTAAPIMTGAPMPTGASAVIPIEESTPDHFYAEGESGNVTFGAGVSAGTFVRRRGSDVVAGSTILSAGTLLGPAQWAVLAASGVLKIPLLSRVKVLVLSTGDELVDRETPLTPGKIYDANSVSLSSALVGAGAEIVAARVVGDDADRLRSIVRDHAAGTDLIVTSGGVSKGAYEIVRDVMEGSGVDFVEVAMQPGGPQGLGVTGVGGREIPVIAFPGNPVSVLVSFEMFLRPVLRELHGLPAARREATALLASELESPPLKHQVRRGRLTEAGEVELVGGASSHLISHYATANILVHVPVGIGHLDAGDPVSIWRIDD